MNYAKKNFLIILDQGLGDTIHLIGVMDLIAQKMNNYNIIIAGTRSSVQVIRNRGYIHDEYIVSQGGNILQRIINFYHAVQFINNNIEECIRFVAMRRGVFYALYAFFTRLLNVRYPYYITALLYLSNCKNIRKPIGGNYKFHYTSQRHYQNILA